VPWPLTEAQDHRNDLYPLAVISLVNNPPLFIQLARQQSSHHLDTVTWVLFFVGHRQIETQQAAAEIQFAWPAVLFT